jgi:PA14 domain/Bacterial Ig domain
LTLSASASDPGGSIASVAFYDYGVLIGSVAAAPYVLPWTPASAGTHAITAVATDNQGAVATSAAAAVIVASAGTVPLPSGAVACASEGGSCTLPAGKTATVFFGGAGHYYFKSARSGDVACSSALFGDPILGVGRSCSYVLSGGTGTGSLGVLTAQYWSNPGLSGIPVATVQELPGLKLSSSQAPRAGLPADGFSVRWSGSLTPLQSGTHRFGVGTSSGDGLRLWVDGALLADTWSSPRNFVEGRINLVAGRPVPIRIEFFDAAGDASVQVMWRQPSDDAFAAIPAARWSTADAAGLAAGLRGEYFAAPDPGAQAPLVRIEAVDFDWGLAAPSQTLPQDNFAVRWTGSLAAPAGGTYQFQTVSDEGVRLWVDGVLLIDNWTPHLRATDTSQSLSLSAGQRVRIRLEYLDRIGAAEMRWRWKTPGSSSFVPVPASALVPY